jgi:hypothetical protein
MTLRTLASRSWLLAWFATWIFASRRTTFPAQTASGLAFLFGASGVIAGLYLFFRGFQLLQRKRWLEDTPVTKIAAAALGQVKIVGKATGPYTLLSPLAAEDCYYYRAVAWNGRNAQDEQKFEARATETIFAPFFLEDETGRLMIDPRGAQLELPSEFDEAISANSMSECARRFLRRHGLSTSGETTVSEYVIKPGDSLLVWGALGEAGAPGREYQSTCLSREAADLQRREQFDAMGVPPSGLPEAAANAVADFDLHPRVILCAGQDRQPLVLSRENPQRMIDDLARRSMFDIWGGPALALFSLGLVMKWLGVW